MRGALVLAVAGAVVDPAVHDGVELAAFGREVEMRLAHVAR